MKDPGHPGAPSLPGFFLYFLRPGAFGFGGPVALANAILVEPERYRRRPHRGDRRRERAGAVSVRGLPEPALVAAGALSGLLACPTLHPAWLLR